MESPFYVGAAIGTTMFTGLSSNSWANNNSVTSTSYSVILGYKLSNYLAIEGEYINLGNPTIVSYSDSNGSFTVGDQFSSYGIGAIAMYPIADPYSVFIKFGFVNTAVTPVCSGAGFYSGPIFNTVFGCNGIVGSIGMGYGAGIQYNVNTSISIRAGYQTYGTGISNISLTGIFGF
jgi:opacity protein-like surface antigen